MSELPIIGRRNEILNAIRKNQVTIVVGETGSGKTSQIPTFMYQDGFSLLGKIAVTQPRRIAAISIATYVAKQLKTVLGDVVGYKIRFEDQTADNTQLKFMTDGILLQEIQNDPELSQYSVIVIDEAHERSANIDFLLGLLKDLLKRRNDLKLVVTSATIDEQKFSRYFWNAPIINVSGRVYPVDIAWSEKYISPQSMIETVGDKVCEIHVNEKPGDILVFMTGREDIDKVIQDLKKREIANLVTVPLYGELSTADQNKIFNRYVGKRKVVVATNIAETSITIDGVVYVVDSGLIKQSSFNSSTGIKSLDVVEHSQSGCNQRAGRAGRVQNGVCYRMYTQANFEARQRFTMPEILRVSLADVVLKMENIGIIDVEGFDFIESPDRAAFHEAYQTLIALGAISRETKSLTAIGRAMASLPLDPKISRMVLEAQKYRCVKNIAIVAAFLSVRNVFSRPKDKEDEADLAHEAFKDSRSDAVTFLNIWRRYEAAGFNPSWCFSNFLNPNNMREVVKVREQLFQILDHHGIELTESDNSEVIAKAVVMGLAYNLFEHDVRGAYRGVQRTNCGYIHIHPASGIFNGFGSTRFIVVTEIAETTKVWGKICTIVEPQWLPELVPHLCTFEKPVVKSWHVGDETAVISRNVIYNHSSIITINKTVSVEDAMKIQDKQIREAQAQGYIWLTFIKSGIGYLAEYHAYSAGVRYKAFSSILIEEGAYYLCTIESFFGREFVNPVIRLFDFPNPTTVTSRQAERLERAPVIKARPSASVTTSPIDLDGLIGKWGARHT